jgi:hypothetical protein
MAGSLPARSAAFGSCDLCADLCLCQPPYQEAAAAGDAPAVSAKPAVTASAQRAPPTTRRSRRDGVLWCRAHKISNFAPGQREIVLSPLQILVDGISFRQVVSVTRRWRIAAKLRSRKRNGTQQSDVAIYSAPLTRSCIPVRFACHAQLRRHCQRCDSISGTRQMPPPKAHRNAGARHDRKSLW